LGRNTTVEKGRHDFEDDSSVMNKGDILTNLEVLEHKRYLSEA
jgi:hypothetical protein